MDDLIYLETVCWDKALQTTRKELIERLNLCPEKQFVVEYEGVVKGVLYTQLIESDVLLDSIRSSHIKNLHQNSNRVMHLLSANVDPSIKLLGAGDQLLEFVLQHAALSNDIDEVVAVTRCSAYDKNLGLDHDEYIHLTDDKKIATDPTLRFHAEHGASIERIIKNYRPNDVANESNGVLVKYNLEAVFLNNDITDSSEKHHTYEEFKDLIVNVANEIGKRRIEFQFEWEMTWSDLGLDSLDILGIRGLLERYTNKYISSTLFFDYPTPSGLLDYFATNDATDVQQKQQSTKEVSLSKVSANDNDIAIVGISCRFPGASNVDEYWELLNSGVDAISDIPDSRWSLSEYYSENIEAGKINHKGGGFLKDVSKFDASFFEVSSREASQIDPQQRLMLELSWEALESAQIPTNTVRKQTTGIYIGQYSSDYQLLLNNSAAFECDGYYATGNAASVTAGRLAYFLGTKGPALTIDTACSSSLVAVHQACQSLKLNEMNIAIVGGVNLILSPHLSIAFSQSGMLASDSRCKTFDDKADGYVRAEGAAVVVLKRLKDAVSDGDPIQGVIKGSAINQDGATNGLTAPNGLSQQALISQALKNADVLPNQISYLEAHGTGTSLGDPIELNAATKVLSKNRAEDNPLYIGSVKTNIGHTEAVSGLAGLIKTVLSIKNKTLPATLNFNSLNKKIDSNSTNLVVPTVSTPWKALETKQCYAGVSSFGFSGTNSHVILSGYDDDSSSVNPVTGHVLSLSAKTPFSLKQKAVQIKEYLGRNLKYSIESLCHSQTVGCDHFEYREAWRIKNKADVISAVNELIDTETFDSTLNTNISVAYLCTGQGSQYAGMAKHLFENSSVFKAVILKCDSLYKDLFKESICDHLFSDTNLINETKYTQTTLYAIEAGLVDYWRSIGVQAEFVMGHSVGEYVAAYAAGVFTLEDGFKLIANRALLIQSLPKIGSMSAVLAPIDVVTKLLNEFDLNKISVAAINGPTNVVVSGETEEVNKFTNIIEQNGFTCKTLEVSHAFHSPLLNSILPEFRKIAETIDFNIPKLRMISNVTGLEETDKYTDPEYWVNHIVNPVNFYAGIQTLNKLACDAWLEIGPKPVLNNMARRGVDGSHHYLSSLDQGINWEPIQQTVAKLYTLGINIKWPKVVDGRFNSQSNTLHYPWVKKHYWFEQGNEKSKTRILHQTFVDNGLVGNKLVSPLKQIQYENVLSIDKYPFLSGHRVYGETVFPATGFIAALIDLYSKERNVLTFGIKDCTFIKPLFLEKDKEYVLHAIMDGAAVTLYTKELSDSDWDINCNCELYDSNITNSQLMMPDFLSDAPYSAKEHYSNVSDLSIEYKSVFKNVSELKKSGDSLLANIAVESTELSEKLALVPVLDGCLQLFYCMIDYDLGHKRTYVPVSFNNLKHYRAIEASVQCHLELLNFDSAKGIASVNLNVFNGKSELLLTIEGLMFKHVLASDFKKPSDLSDLLYEINWLPKINEIAPAAMSFVNSKQACNNLVSNNNRLYENRENERTKLDELSVCYFAHALKLLLPESLVGDSFKTKEVTTLNSIGGHFVMLFEHILTVLKQHKFISSVDDQTWKLSESFEQLVNKNIENNQSGGSEGLELVQRFGENLFNILISEVDPARLLFPEDKFKDTAEFYRNGNAFFEHNQLLAKTISALVKDVPKDKNIRLLEIGAGTGGVSYHVLKALKNENIHYTFTDISAYFTNQVTDQFSEYSGMEYAVLDIEKCPEIQGFNTEYYDIVIASNVIHATKNIKDSISNIYKMLAPNGRLVLLEGTEQTTWIDLVFGCMDGWWRFKDRESYPLLSVERWNQLLGECNFQSYALSQNETYTNQELFKQAIIVADADKKLSSAENQAVLILSDESTLVSNLHNEFNLAGYEVVVQLPKEDDWAVLLKGNRFTKIIDVYNADDCNDVIAYTNVADVRLMNNVKAILAHNLMADVDYWVVTSDAQSEVSNEVGLAESTLWGIVKSIRLEHPEFNIKCLDLSRCGGTTRSTQYCIESFLYPDLENQIVYNHQQRLVARLNHREIEDVDYSSPITDSYQLISKNDGDLNSVQWHECDCISVKENDVEVEVYSTGINFRDVLNVLGLYPGDAGPIGDEFSGKIVSISQSVSEFKVGDEVFGVAAGTFKKYITTSKSLIVKKPGNISFNEAATIPIVFLTTYYSLIELAGIKQGQSVLIHAAAGGIGQAAIQIAKSKDAVIFATASTHKHAYLKSQGVDYVFNSRSLDFYSEVKEITNSEGIDVVINSLSGDFIEKSISLLKDNGCFIELGKRSVLSIAEAKAKHPLIQYHLVDLLHIIRNKPETINGLLLNLTKQFQNNVFSPIVHKEYPLKKVVNAFRYLQQGRNIGKLVINHKKTGEDLFKQKACYVITGGLGGLSLTMIEWMMSNGAAHFVLLSRSIPTQGIEKHHTELREKGAFIKCYQCDISNLDQLKSVLNIVSEDSVPIKGIFHSAGVLSDAVIDYQSEESFRSVLAPKVSGAWHLHTITMSWALDYFVMFSSTASLLGNQGQTNHSAANMFMDALAGYRHRMGLLGVSINWSAWQGIGAAVETNVVESFKHKGVGALTIEQGLQSLEEILSQNYSQVGVVPFDWDTFRKNHMGRDDLFYEAMHEVAVEEKAADLEEDISEIIYNILDKNNNEQNNWLSKYLQLTVKQVLRLQVTVSNNESLSNFGLDSLTSIEIKARVNNEIGVNLPLEVFFKESTIESWINQIISKINLKNIATSLDVDHDESKDTEEFIL